MTVSEILGLGRTEYVHFILPGYSSGMGTLYRATDSITENHLVP